MTTDEAWDALIDIGVSKETLRIITFINGYSIDTMNDVLYATAGYRSFDQL